MISNPCTKRFESVILPKLAENGSIVLTGNYALFYSGFSMSVGTSPDVLTDNLSLRGFRLSGYVNWCYVPCVDYDNYVIPHARVSNVLVSIPERVYVECIRSDFGFIDLGEFCDSLERYQHSREMNYKLLQEVARKFNVPMGKVDYWLHETSDFNSY